MMGDACWQAKVNLEHARMKSIFVSQITPATWGQLRSALQQPVITKPDLPDVIFGDVAKFRLAL